MTPGARIQSAAELGAEIAAATVPPDTVIKGYFRKRRYAGSKDRHVIAGQVYRVLRRRARLDWWIDRVLPAPGDARTRIIADLVLGERQTLDQIVALFNGARHCPAHLGDAEEALVRALEEQPLDHPDMPRWVTLEYPAWLDDVLGRGMGPSLEAEMTALNRPAPVDLRVNTAKGDRSGAKDALGREDIHSRPTALSPLGLRLLGRARLGNTEAFRRGLVEVQDEGSQLIALLCDARPGMTVIDFCAGAGGKTLALAAAMDGRGTLIACDSSHKRLARMDDRLRRAGAHRVRTQVLEPTGDPWLARHAASADRVLVDAPCSGTGAWRRDPDARWRLTPEALDSMIENQGDILAAAAGLVRPGGRLIYATCSLLKEENEDQVAGFLAAHDDVVPLDVAGVWDITIGGPCPGTGAHLRLSPAATGTDGFFSAVLERRA
jgi:16S rRNA (cytosine967-C5)-methyltransferase